MGILSAYPTTQWTLFLNRAELSTESALTLADITVGMETLTALSGSGTARRVTFGTAVAAVQPTSVVLAGHPGMHVIGGLPTESLAFLDQVRNILRIGLTPEDLSDFQIQQSAFLGKAELDTYAALNTTPAAYAAKAASEPLYEQRVRTAVLYRTAALLVPSLPEILENTLRSERIRYAELDWQQRINYFLKVANDAIAEDTTSADVAGGVVIATLATRETYF